MEIREGERHEEERKREEMTMRRLKKNLSQKSFQFTDSQLQFFDKNQLNIIRMAMIIKVDLRLVIKDAHSLLNELLDKKRERKKFK